MKYAIVVFICERFKKEVEDAIKAESFRDVTVMGIPCISCLKSNNSALNSEEINIYYENKEPLLILTENCAEKIRNYIKNIDEENIVFISKYTDLFVPRSLVKHVSKGYSYLITSGELLYFLGGCISPKVNYKMLVEFIGHDFNKFLYLDTELLNSVNNNIQKLATLINTSYKVLPVGMGYLRVNLKLIISRFQHNIKKKNLVTKLNEMQQESANFQMTLDLINSLSQFNKESEVIDRIFSMFSMFFAPGNLSFISITNNKINKIHTFPKKNQVDKPNLMLFENDPTQEVTFKDDSLIVKISHNNNLLGYIHAENIEFPNYKERYLDTAMTVSKICGLSIFNARTYQKLQDSIDNLKRSNEDLEEFAHIISHDLKQPLTNILSEINLIEAFYEKNLDFNPIDLLKLAENSVFSMNDMINGLLNYSKIGRSKEPKKKINLMRTIKKILENLKSLIKSHKAIIKFEDLPNIFADETETIHLFQNLIENALKYRSQRPPIIKITSKREDHYWKFGVKDNGIGIDSKDFKKIFMIFRRVGDQKLYSGTGIGLSICRKIVERRGGQIWVESELGKGSTFYFTTPIFTEN